MEGQMKTKAAIMARDVTCARLKEHFVQCTRPFTPRLTRTELHFILALNEKKGLSEFSLILQYFVIDE